MVASSYKISYNFITKNKQITSTSTALYFAQTISLVYYPTMKKSSDEEGKDRIVRLPPACNAKMQPQKYMKLYFGPFIKFWKNLFLRILSFWGTHFFTVFVNLIWAIQAAAVFIRLSIVLVFCWWNTLDTHRHMLRTTHSLSSVDCWQSWC